LSLPFNLVSSRQSKTTDRLSLPFCLVSSCQS
jgi:hypothetical protein